MEDAQRGPAASTIGAGAEDPVLTPEEVVVTGSRISRSGFSAPTPTTMVGAEDLERAAVSNAADLLNTLPAFRGSVTPTVSTVAPGVGASYLDLRGLGVSRTLTLVNGQRYVSSNLTGQVDFNLIPSIMIERTEVVTGGASAAYGSDAVAGVVNVIYKRNVEGVEATVQAGQSAHGDDEEINVGILYGTAFGGDRGHLLIGGQYVDNKGGDALGSRDWGRKDWNIIANPNATATNGEPTRLLVQNVRNSNQTLGGLVRAPASLSATQFLSGGEPAPFTFGSLVGPTFMVGGDGVNTQQWVLLKAPIERGVITARADYELSPNLTASAEFSYGHQEITSTSGQAQDQLIVQRDNAFLPESMRTAMIAANASTLTVGRRSADLFPDDKLRGAPIQGETTLKRGVFSLRGDFADSWTWDAYYQRGESENDQRIGLRIHDNWLRAIDAIVDPATNGIVCRATLSPDPAVRAAADGCVPFDIFGPYSRSTEAADYVTATGVNTLQFEQDVVSASMQGELFSTWAGPVSVAVGAEHRREEAASVVDPISLAKGFDLINVQPISGVNEVNEGFFETVAPIISDKPGARLLELNGAVRYTDYSLSGGVTTWKAGLTYVPVEGLRFRGTRSRDIRAPNLEELFSPLQGTLRSVFDPVTRQTVATQINTGGNTDLRPEFADTTTIGVVLSPSWLPGFNASVDFYDIKIEGAITTLAPDDIIGRCFSGSTNLCSRVIRDASGQLVSIDQVYENLAVLSTRGVDFEISYRRSLEDLWSWASGDLTIRLIANYTDEWIQDDGRVAIDVAGDTGGRRPGGLPRWSGTSIISYSRGPLELGTEFLYVGSGKLDALGNSKNLNTNHVPSRTYVQLFGSYEIPSLKGNDQRMEVFGTINNLFDADPPVAISPNAFPTNAALFDTIGRSFTVGARFAF